MPETNAPTESALKRSLLTGATALERDGRVLLDQAARARAAAAELTPRRGRKAKIGGAR